MNREETIDCMNLFKTMWSSAFKEPTVERRQMYTEMWCKQLGQFKHQDVKDALYHLQANYDGKYEPSMKQIIDAVRYISHRNGNVSQGYRRIVTTEEVRSDMYIELIQIINRTEDSMEVEQLKEKALRLRDDYLLFHGDGWLERYQKHFNTTKTREEFERL